MTATFTFGEILQALEACHPMLLSQRKTFTEPAALSTDTRTLKPGDFFVPLSGENFDGHDHIDTAFQKGAVGALVFQNKFKPAWEDYPNIIAVDSPVEGYLQLARFHRRRINPVVVALTGSSGKTTTKDMLFAALSPLVKTQCTQKNFNNEVGVSQTLLALEPDTQLLIVEMGMRGLHQIELLSHAAEPDVALITNVGPAHIGLLGSLENIALAKLEISEGLDGEGYLIINGDDPLLVEKSPGIWYGQRRMYLMEDASNITATPEGGMQFTYKDHVIKTPLPGLHQVSNALAVLAVGEILEFTVDELAPGIAAFEPKGARWNRESIAGYTDAWLINDAYNANPDSFRASLQAFLEMPSTYEPKRSATDGAECRKILILGGMKELGEFSDHYHRQLGEWLSGEKDIDAIFTVGEEAQVMHDALGQSTFTHHAATVEETIPALRARYSSFDHCMLFLKGSRANGLEKIAEAVAASTHT